MHLSWRNFAHLQHLKRNLCLHDHLHSTTHLRPRYKVQYLLKTFVTFPIVPSNIPCRKSALNGKRLAIVYGLPDLLAADSITDCNCWIRLRNVMRKCLLQKRLKKNYGTCEVLSLYFSTANDVLTICQNCSALTSFRTWLGLLANFNLSWSLMQVSTLLFMIW